MEIEKDNVHLTRMLGKVENVYNDGMLKELEGIYSILSEIE